MSRKKLQNVKEIIDRLKMALKLETDTELAKYLGVNQSTVSAWKLRKSINWDLIITKCKDINLDWLLTGEGEMMNRPHISVTAQGHAQTQIVGKNNTVTGSSNSVSTNPSENKRYDPKVEKIIKLLTEGYYSPKLLDEFLKRLEKIKEASDE